MQTMTSGAKQRLWLLVGLLWVLWAVRAHEIMQLPVFVDESLHIMRAQIVFEYTDSTASILPGKLLLYYYLGVFDPQDVGGAWLARQAVALLAPLGAALTFVLAQQLFRRWTVGVLAVVLYALTPFMVFFERMALSDTLVMVFGLALAIAVLRLARNPSRLRAVQVGLLYGLAILAKLIALPWLLLPLLAIWFFGRSVSWIRWREYLVIGGITTGLVLLPSTLYVFYQEIWRADEKEEVVTTSLFVPEDQSRTEQILHNADTYREAIVVMFTGGLVVLFFSSLLVDRKSWLYLMGITASVWGFVLVISALPSTRYLVLGVPPILILIAAGVDAVFRERPALPLLSYWPTIIVFIAMLSTWAVLSINFLLNAWNDPPAMQLAERDVWEYFENTATGYGLREAAADLPHLSPLPAPHSANEVPVVGFLGACHTLRLYLPENSSVRTECPYFRWNLTQADATLAAWEQRVRDDGEWYVLADDQQPIDLQSLPFEWQELAVYERPHDGIPVRLYHVRIAQ